MPKAIGIAAADHCSLRPCVLKERQRGRCFTAVMGRQKPFAAECLTPVTHQCPLPLVVNIAGQ